MTADTITHEARSHHLQAVRQRLISNAPLYNFLLSPSTIVRSSAGEVVLHLPLDACHVNSRGTVHGAVSSAIVDFSTGLAIASHDLRDTTGASVDMHVSYLGTAKVGDTLEIVATAEKVGGSMAFTNCKINRIDGDDRVPVSMGRHTKFVKIGQKKPEEKNQG
ncbi:uncharacterized protein J7T54_001834 [Emericellopsis cladophorae]|uniref:Thioesterase domain-containing protein n=1 Tax=Emericellopsis cladophorae TaxID=2686198 RepID=A0A9P9Y5I5_9HYPO|nr:uncharacterized protein J7T54_001834 [Emericellopsis cladophorae]KAI6783958.1 hypothetical protein J7T54_001834 [Emericellopsis cladophorae]